MKIKNNNEKRDELKRKFDKCLCELKNADKALHELRFDDYFFLCEYNRICSCEFELKGGKYDEGLFYM